MKSTRGTRTLTIGELKLRLMGVDLAAQEIDKAVATEFDVLVEYVRHEFAVEVKAIKASANVHFGGDNFSATAMHGTDLMPLFSGAQVSALEDRIMMALAAGESDDA